MKIQTIFIIFLIFTMSLHAQKVPKILKQFDEEIKELANEKIKEISSSEYVAKKIGMKFPPPSVKLNSASIKDQIKKQVIIDVEEKFPSSKITETEEKGKQLYRLYKVGETLKFEIPNEGIRGSINGKFYKRTKTHALIGNRELLIRRLPTDIRAHFDPILSKRKIATYVKNKTFYYKEDRKKYAKKLAIKYKAKFYKAAGYYPVKKKWVTPIKKLAVEMKNFENKQRPVVFKEIRKKFYESKGYHLVKNKWILKKNTKKVKNAWDKIFGDKKKGDKVAAKGETKDSAKKDIKIAKKTPNKTKEEKLQFDDDF